MNKNKILVIAGPSAVGKTTVMKEILSSGKGFEYIRSATTRPPRTDGNADEYIYLSKAEFSKRINDGKMLEYTEFDGNLYGTPSSEIERIFANGRVPLLILDINGVKALKAQRHGFSVFAVYLTANEKLLDERLYSRAVAEGLTVEALAVYERRKAQNRADAARLSELSGLFDAVIENRTVAHCTADIISHYEK